MRFDRAMAVCESGKRRSGVGLCARSARSAGAVVSLVPEDADAKERAASAAIELAGDTGVHGQRADACRVVVGDRRRLHG